MKKIIFFSLWIFIAISCDEDPPPSGFGELEGYVFLGNKTHPLPNLGIRVSGNILTFTDLKGYFYLSRVPEGLQKFEILDEDLVPFFSSSVPIISDDLTYIEIPFTSIKKPLPDFSAVYVHNESNWDYWVVGKEEYFFIDEENSLPKFVLYHSFKNKKDYGIMFNDKGLPDKVFADDFIFMFSNFNGNKVDLGILFPSGDIEVVREIQTDFVWPSNLKSDNSTLSKAEFIRWTGRIVGAIPCVTSGAAALISGGFAIPLALWTCGNYFLKMADNFFDDANVQNGFTDFVDNYKLNSTAYSCISSPDPTSCLISLASMGLDKYASYVEDLEYRTEDLLRLQQRMNNNFPLRNLTIQPGPLGKDAGIQISTYSNGASFYNNFPNDSLISVVSDGDLSGSKQMNRMLFQFPLGEIPLNAVIFSARLEVYGYALSNVQGVNPSIALSELKGPWSESEVSWTNQPESEFIEKIDFIPEGVYSWHSWDVTYLVQDWVLGRKANYGFLISAGANYVWGEIYSGDHPYSSRRLKLVISYY
mgnify:CR=1 FL=1